LIFPVQSAADNVLIVAPLVNTRLVPVITFVFVPVVAVMLLDTVAVFKVAVPLLIRSIKVSVPWAIGKLRKVPPDVVDDRFWSYIKTDGSNIANCSKGGSYDIPDII
jgi:hypothetical protein